jgi:hypothetical protein
VSGAQHAAHERAGIDEHVEVRADRLDPRDAGWRREALGDLPGELRGVAPQRLASTNATGLP